MNTLYSVYGNGFFIADFSLRWDHTNYDTHLLRCFWAREKISELLNEILDLSKVEAGRMELELATFDLPLAIDNARTFVRERATKHGINLEVSIDERLGDYVGTSARSSRFSLICYPTP